MIHFSIDNTEPSLNLFYYLLNYFLFFCWPCPVFLSSLLMLCPAGWWLMHCHLLFHSELDMVAALHVGKPEDLPPVPEGFPTCGSFMPAL